MKLGGGVVNGSPRGTALPTLLLGHSRARLRCYSSSSSIPIPDHITFIKDVAVTQPPQHLCHLLRMLKTKGGFFHNLVTLFVSLSLGFLMSLAMCICICSICCSQQNAVKRNVPYWVLDFCIHFFSNIKCLILCQVLELV